MQISFVAARRFMFVAKRVLITRWQVEALKGCSSHHPEGCKMVWAVLSASRLWQQENLLLLVNLFVTSHVPKPDLV